MFIALSASRYPLSPMRTHASIERNEWAAGSAAVRPLAPRCGGRSRGSVSLRRGGAELGRKVRRVDRVRPVVLGDQPLANGYVQDMGNVDDILAEVFDGQDRLTGDEIFRRVTAAGADPDVIDRFRLFPQGEYSPEEAAYSSPIWPVRAPVWPPRRRRC